MFTTKISKPSFFLSLNTYSLTLISDKYYGEYKYSTINIYIYCSNNTIYQDITTYVNDIALGNVDIAVRIAYTNCAFKLCLITGNIDIVAPLITTIALHICQ